MYNYITDTTLTYLRCNTVNIMLVKHRYIFTHYELSRYKFYYKYLERYGYTYKDM